MMTKLEEKEWFANLIKISPDGYVRDILQGIEPEVCKAVECDYGFILFQDTEKLAAERDALKKEVAELEKKRHDLEWSIKTLEARRARAVDTLKDDLSKFQYEMRKLVPA